MTQSHWTEETAEAFAHRIAFDFIAQVENRMDALPMKQVALARELGVSDGAVSKLLNNPQNLTLLTIAKYSRALGMKAAIVAYDDSDPVNERGPINSEIFATCWNLAGRPRDKWDLEKIEFKRSTTEGVMLGPVQFLGCAFSGIGSPFSFATRYWSNQPPFGYQFTTGVLPLNAVTMSGGASADARD